MPEPPPTLEDLLGPSVDEPEEDEALTANERAILGRWNETKPEGAPSISETEALDARKYMEPFGFTFEQALTAYGLFVAGRPGIPPPDQASAYAVFERTAGIAGRAAETVRAATGAAAPISATLSTGRPDIDKLVNEVAGQYGVDPNLLMGFVIAESGGDPGAHNPGTPANPEDSWGLLQLNFLGGQGQGFVESGAISGHEDVIGYPEGARKNLELGAQALLAAVALPGARNLQGQELFDFVAVNSGHGGIAGFTGGASVAGDGTIADIVARGFPGEGEPERQLTNTEYAEWTALNQLYGIPQNVYVTAKKILGIDPLQYWNEVKGYELQDALARNFITPEQFQEAYYRRLSLGQVENADRWGYTLEEYSNALDSGLTDEDLRTANRLGIPLENYTWARQNGLSTEAIANSVRDGVSLEQAVGNARLEGITAQVEAEFAAQWDKVTSQFRPEVLATPGFQDYLDYRRAQLASQYVSQRLAQEQRRVSVTLAPARAPAGTIPVITPGGAQNIFYNPTTNEYVTAEPPAEPEAPVPIKMPGTDELIEEAARSGVVTTYAGPPVSLYPEDTREMAAARRRGAVRYAGISFRQQATGVQEEFMRIQLGRAMETKKQEQVTQAAKGAQYAAAYQGARQPVELPQPEKPPPKKRKPLVVSGPALTSANLPISL